VRVMMRPRHHLRRLRLELHEAAREGRCYGLLPARCWRAAAAPARSAPAGWRSGPPRSWRRRHHREWTAASPAACCSVRQEQQQQQGQGVMWPGGVAARGSHTPAGMMPASPEARYSCSAGLGDSAHLISCCMLASWCLRVTCEPASKQARQQGSKPASKQKASKQASKQAEEPMS
jgi:hypothetical protein